MIKEKIDQFLAAQAALCCTRHLHSSHVAGHCEGIVHHYQER